MKYTKLNQWLWRWHVIAGLVSLPFVLVLAITGAIYLFKDNVETPHVKSIQEIEAKGNAIRYSKQLEIANSAMHKKPNSMVIPVQKSQATEFVSGKFSHKTSAFVNPYTSTITGNFSPKDTWMYTVRKLHGELLGGAIGTKIVELIASWMIVLLLTGVYVFWPNSELGIKGFFRIRTKLGSRILLRDIHAIGGFWLSGLLLLTLAGGLPWTDVFGASFKQLQKVTHTGFPPSWFGVGIKSVPNGEMISLDKALAISKQQNLPGTVTIDFPKSRLGVYSVSNITMPLKNMKKIHFDAYSGKKLLTLGWNNIGILMRARLWVMAFHQGQMGFWNFLLMFFVSIGLSVISIAGFFSFKARSWGIPEAPKKIKVSAGATVFIILLAIILPLFGVSLLFIMLGTYLFKLMNK